MTSPASNRKPVAIALILIGVLLLGINYFHGNLGAKDAPVPTPEPTKITDTNPAPITPPPPTVPGSTDLFIPILVYHRIEPMPADAGVWTKQMVIEPALFEKHMQYLADNKFNPIHFSDVTNYFEKGTPLPPRPILLTFDDGWKNIYANAFPVLKKFRLTGTLYIVSNYVGYGAYLNLDELKELRDYGMEIGAHSLSHPSLTKVKNAREEISESKKNLEEKLGVTITTFAYPNGSYSDSIELMTQQAGYKTGRTFTNGQGISKDNLFELKVVRIDKNVGLENWEKQLYPEGHP